VEARASGRERRDGDSTANLQEEIEIEEIEIEEIEIWESLNTRSKRIEGATWKAEGYCTWRVP
jgi:hypothetical protein